MYSSGLKIKVIGTHNSYHRQSVVPGMKRFWPYRFPSLADQLDGGVRHLELDVHYDWKTRRYVKARQCNAVARSSLAHRVYVTVVNSCACVGVLADFDNLENRTIHRIMNLGRWSVVERRS